MKYYESTPRRDRLCQKSSEISATCNEKRFPKFRSRKKIKKEELLSRKNIVPIGLNKVELWF
jgi:hypothetical protein